MTDRALLRLFNSLLVLLGLLLALTGILMIIDPSQAAGLRGFNSSAAEPVSLIFPGGEAGPAFDPGPLLLAPLDEQNAPPPSDANTQISTEAPARIQIASIQLDAPVTPAIPGTTTLNGLDFRIWDVPAGFVVGWHTDSARLGEAGNVVLNGHHNTLGQVFARLVDLEPGAEITVYGESQAYPYRVTEKYLLPEDDQPIDVRLANSQWILPTQAARLTLVTCWPYETNTHRLIIIAEP